MRTAALKKLTNAGYMIFYGTPFYLRFVYWPAKNFMSFVSGLRSQQWLITGEEKNSKNPLSLLFIGTVENKNYLSHLIFRDNYTEKSFGFKWSWQLKKQIKQAKSVYPIIIRELSTSISGLPKERGSFYIPCWVRWEIDTTKDPDSKWMSESLKSDIRRIKRNDLQYEITNDIVWFDRFYHEMYVPNLTKTYGNMAFIQGYDQLKVLFKDCDLLLVKQGQEYLGGMIIYQGKKDIRLLVLGVKDSDRDFSSLGVISALYYFSYIHLKQKGYPNINLGGTRAFLDDGLLNYKKKWEPYFDNTIVSGFFSLSVQMKNEAVRGFLVNNPFIFVYDHKFNGAIFFSENIRLEEANLSKINKNYFIVGINKLYVYQFCSDNVNIQDNVPSQFADRISFHTIEG
jgi:hypothetical protein